MKLPIIWFLGAVHAWNAVYLLDRGKVYVHLDNDDLVSLNFSVLGFDDPTPYLIEDVDYNNDDTVETLASPPANSTIVLVDDSLYAFAPDGSDDGCGDGLLSLLKYNDDEDAWADVELDTDDIDDASFYADATYLTSFLENNTIYLYGGRCSDGSITSRLLLLSLDTYKLANISTATVPQGFYGATNVNAPDPQTQLVIGGRSSEGWLSMYQLATWDFSSGWSFKEVTGQQSLASRTGALALPIFSPVANNSVTTISNDFSVSQVLLLGGDGDNIGTKAARLDTSDNDWLWAEVDPAFDVDDILGAATIFNTLVVFNKTTSDKSKRDTSYKLLLYDTTTFESVDNIKGNTDTDTDTASSGTTVQTKALLGTLIPLAAIATVVAAGMFLFKRKRKHDDLEQQDYHMGYYHQKSPSSWSHLFPQNDLASTLDGASIDSWVKKRQQYEDKRRSIKRHSYFSSNETLNQVEEVNDENPFDDASTPSPPPPPPKCKTSSPHPYQKLTQESKEESPVLRSVSKLKKSFSFTVTPPASPLRKKSTMLPRPSLMEGEVSDTEDVASQASSVVDDMDVQVLVSLKRRSKLRVVNPDLENLEEQSIGEETDIEEKIEGEKV